MAKLKTDVAPEDIALQGLEWIDKWARMPNLVVLLIVLLSCTLRYATSYHPYSGAGIPPMYGDFEAQRHWMELTNNIPLKDWYFNTTDNDLGYWGLDYPPLTAYHSWVMGKIAASIQPDLIELHSSRGIETPTTKLFMRLTVFFSDLLVFIPAIIFTINRIYPRARRPRKQLACLFVLTLPSIILIDHGHFQYNTVSLGFAAWALGFFAQGSPLFACIAFVLSFCYKQISLYYAPSFFFIMLGACLKQSTYAKAFLSVMYHGIAVVGTFLICFAPFLIDVDIFLQVLHRIFPFSRGLLEGKVANFWCVSNVFIKWPLIFSLSELVKLCLATTSASLLPNAFFAIRKPCPIQLLYSLSNCSLSFFLFSFHVHQKSILFPLLPISMLCLHDPVLAQWMSTISTFSLYPLMKQDDLVPAYICLQVIGFIVNLTLPIDTVHSQQRTRLLSFASKLSSIGVVFLHLSIALIPAPSHLQDLHELMIATYSALHFALFWMLCVWEQYQFKPETSSKTKTE